MSGEERRALPRGTSSGVQSGHSHDYGLDEAKIRERCSHSDAVIWTQIYSLPPLG